MQTPPKNKKSKDSKKEAKKGRISELSQEIISKVAAGEVIENPASTVKELVENSLDAEATHITIELEKGGLEKIRVVDNGIGMPKEDLAMCYKRYTTSKVKPEDYELAYIEHLGFRGEALYSISAISKIQIQSKVWEDLAGSQITVTGNVPQGNITPIGMPDGTIVSVSDIFFNTPARKKFLAEPGIEFKSVVQEITQIAAGNPKVGFTLKNNGKVYLHLPKAQDFKKRMEYLFGESFVQNLLEIPLIKSKGDSQGIFNFHGFISKPQYSYPTKDMQFLYVNQRHVDHKPLSDVIKAAYGTLLENKLHPAFLLFFEIPATRLDINIHPRKKRLRFLDETEILEEISLAVKGVLGNSNLSYSQLFAKKLQEGNGQTTEETTELEKAELEKNEEKAMILRDRKANKFLLEMLKTNASEAGESWNIKTNQKTKKYEEILQVNNLYLITETPDGIMIIDQHAAHERILYEQFLEQYIIEKEKRELIELGKIIEFPYNLAPLFEHRKAHLEQIGFEIISFGKNSFKIERIPKLFEKHNIETLLVELLTDLEAHSKNFADTKSLKTISYLACRSAIKAGEYLTHDERKNLLEKLENTKTNYTCPHGRPVKLHISFGEMARLFKRA